jgi:uncharacterized membrane protein (UPF0127 family)
MTLRSAERRASDPHPIAVDSRLDRLPSYSLPPRARLYVAGDRRSRARGLAGLHHLAPDHALLLAGCRSVHTFGMRFALDLLWLDGADQLIRLDAGVAPRRLRTCLRARAVIETGAGCGERFAALLAASQITSGT